MYDINILNVAEACELFQKWRENNERNSEDVIYIWKAVLEYNLTKLGNDKYSILEQVCIAALDCYRIDVVDFCIKQLSYQFPNSTRVKKLYAMRLEAQEQYDDALRVLDLIIKSDDTNSESRKRKIAILKAQRKNTEAIKELTEYLKVFMADTEAWQELSELYISEQDFNKAAFCLEELILHNPHNHLLHQRYADIRYTQGGFDNLELARAYYCQALRLNSNNIRALYGLFLSASNISVSSKCAAQKKKENSKIAEWAMTEINKKYTSVKNKNLNIEECLAALQIS
ncbi:ER membrane protein complex subunit 2-like [Agrilus planipennis]|uniref:ER membrane protein complex subunit 2 n=1 Tax=Agrilus planipennis TaxID=224129 RepID=A0A1W4WNE0_AGRPL|nr:ER membrane protein complex subunit 2-like [Agrilus planipennis]